MKNKHLKILTWVACTALLVLMGCKTTKVQVATPAEEIQPKTPSITQTYHQNIGSIHCQFNLILQGNKFLSLSGTLQSVTNKELMVSVKAILGIEVMRIYCTPTKAVLIDRLGRRVCEMPFEELEPELGTDFYGLQGLLTNQLFDPDQNQYANFTHTQKDGNIILTHNGKYQTEFLIQGGTFLQRSIIRSVEKGDYLMATYSAITEVSGTQFPSKAQYIYHSKERNNTVDVTFNRIQFNQLNQLDFEVPGNYKTTTVNELKKQLLSL